MKKTLLLLASLAFAALAFTAIAAQPEIEHKVHLKIIADDDLVDVELDDLAIGDSQQLFTESGKQVVITRKEAGYEFDIEGRDEPILVRTGTQAYAFAHDHSCDGDDCPQHVVIKKHVNVTTDGDGAGQQMIFMSDDGEVHRLGDGEDVTWIAGEGSGDGKLHVIELDGASSAAERLLASGVLDSLDDAKRQEILDALRDGERKVEVKVISKRHQHEDQ